jgi:hypothetical protein
LKQWVAAVELGEEEEEEAVAAVAEVLWVYQTAHFRRLHNR